MREEIYVIRFEITALNRAFYSQNKFAIKRRNTISAAVTTNGLLLFFTAYFIHIAFAYVFLLFISSTFFYVSTSYCSKILWQKICER